ncbi:MAG: GxxExxY protein, partial [bacterium]|nr:GxxExxY protein [bacterium]
MTQDLRRGDLLYPELSYKTIGILFEVDNQLGPGHKEKYYENAVAEALRSEGLEFKQQLHAPLLFKEKVV